MTNYNEPELMYALDSKGKYSDWKNVYNVSGDDICYCPICLGKVKLWNGQDPNRKYSKQKCFHHLPGEGCTKESYIHFVYKNWLLDEGSKFIVGNTTHLVKEVVIEQCLNTAFGVYKPDIQL